MLEYDGSTGAPLAWTAQGPGLDAPLARIDLSGGTRTGLIPDIQGSVIGELSSSGTLTKTAYLPYGENDAPPGTGQRYTARRLDPETAGSTAQPSGLYYYRARTYSPAWGRFLQPDPIGLNGGNNLYAYVLNDPLNAVDPSGLDTYFFHIGGTIAGLLGGTGAAGAYATTENAYGLPDIGVFESHGPAVGVMAGASVEVGMMRGSTEDFEGRSINVEGAYSFGSGTLYFKPRGSKTFNELSGASAGVGVGTPIGGALSAPKTKAFGLLEDIIIPTMESVKDYFVGNKSKK